MEVEKLVHKALNKLNDKKLFYVYKTITKNNDVVLKNGKMYDVVFGYDEGLRSDVADIIICSLFYRFWK